MISSAMFLLFFGLLVFGPRKTLEMSQSLGKLVAKMKHATADWSGTATEPLGSEVRNTKSQKW